MASFRILAASGERQRVTIPTHETFNFNVDQYQPDENGGICYECGSNLKIEEDRVEICSPQLLMQPNVSGMEYEYTFDCPRCGLEEIYLPGMRWYASVSTYDVGRIVTRSNAAWKAWFKKRIEDIIAGGSYPRWLRTGRPAAINLGDYE